MAHRPSSLFLASSLAWIAGCSSAADDLFSTDGAGGGGEGAGQASGGAGPSGGPSTGSTTSSTATGTGTGAGGSGGCPTCDPGTVCENGVCVPGCSPTAPCPGTEECCGGSCLDTSGDPANCGGCGAACPDLANVTELCGGGLCEFGACDGGFTNCDGNATNGCETTGLCACTPGLTQPCYNGPGGTAGVGACLSGTQTCLPSGLGWGFCSGQVLPISEVCADNVDNDCDMQTDEDPDLDGDGWGVCAGDCCDTVSATCSDPVLVNPGAYEFPGNMVDDDCNPATSDVGTPTTCSTVAKFSGVTPIDVLNAMDLCQMAQGTGWGIVSASFLLANGNAPSAAQLANMQGSQAAIMTNYGPGNVPQLNATFAGISSGAMRDAGDAGFVQPNSGTNFNSSSTPPADYLAAHGGALPSSAGCSGTCPAGSGANDSINVRASIRVPTNAQSLSYKFRFFSSEYWTWSCTAYNDFYLARLTSGAPGIPLDKNISFDALGNPVSVNNGFFDACTAKGCYTCPLGMGPLAGTGMETANTGGATSWLTTTAPVVGGETITMDFMVFDVSDGILDTNVLLDQFEFSVTPSGVGTTD